MSSTYTYSLAWNSGAAIRSQTVSVSDAAALSIDESIADETTDGEVACVIDQSEIAGLWLESDQAITVETNNGGAPDDTIALAADVPVFWFTGFYATCPITADVTALFITNASGSAANFKLRCLYDSTP